MRNRPELRDKLTARQRKIITLISQGKTNHQIGKALFISIGVVTYEIEKIITIMRAKNRAHVVALAIRYGVINP